MTCAQNEALKRFLAGEMTPEEEAAFAAHLAQCPECIEAMSSLLEAPPEATADPPALAHLKELEPPPGISECIIREMLRRKRQEFRRYCLRVAFSAAAAITLVLTSFVGIGTQIGTEQFTQPLTLSQQMALEESRAEAFREFSLSEFITEVFDDAKEK